MHMSTRSVLNLDGWKSKLKSLWDYDPEDRAYVAVLVGLTLSMFGFYYLTLGAESYDTIQIPRLTIYATLILFAGAFLNAFFDLGRIITPEEEDGDEEDMFDTEATGLSFDLSYTMLARKTGVIVLYFIGVYYVGYYTISALFTFLYVLLNTDESGIRRWIRAGLLTVLVVALLWVIFDYFLGMIQIYRLGPLP